MSRKNKANKNQMNKNNQKRNQQTPKKDSAAASLLKSILKLNNGEHIVNTLTDTSIIGGADLNDSRINTAIVANIMDEFAADISLTQDEIVATLKILLGAVKQNGDVKDTHLILQNVYQWFNDVLTKDSNNICCTTYVEIVSYVQANSSEDYCDPELSCTMVIASLALIMYLAISDTVNELNEKIAASSSHQQNKTEKSDEKVETLKEETVDDEEKVEKVEAEVVDDNPDVKEGENPKLSADEFMDITKDYVAKILRASNVPFNEDQLMIYVENLIKNSDGKGFENIKEMFNETCKCAGNEKKEGKKFDDNCKMKYSKYKGKSYADRLKEVTTELTISPDRVLRRCDDKVVSDLVKHLIVKVTNKMNHLCASYVIYDPDTLLKHVTDITRKHVQSVDDATYQKYVDHPNVFWILFVNDVYKYAINKTLDESKEIKPGSIDIARNGIPSILAKSNS